MSTKKPPLTVVETDTGNQSGDALEQAMAFVESIFGKLPEGARVVLVKAVIGKPPGYPSSQEAFSKSCRKGERLQCYFGTASVLLDEGKIYNRKRNFAEFKVLVIDDLGTGKGSKCPVEALPKDMRLKPTFIIESSKDNYQYGYVLPKPITDLGEASALVNAMYSAGPWDSGGAQATKLVRLPLGYHKSGFEVKLISHKPDNLWTPEALIEATGAVVGAVKKRRIARASRFGRDAADYDFGGIIDPVVDALDKAGLIETIGDEWITIQCPWADTHSEGGDTTAGYSPIGLGGDQYQLFRSFHCHHDHCSGRNSDDFMRWVANSLGLSLPRYDPSGPLLRDYIYDRQSDEAVRVSRGTGQKIQAFRNDKAGTVAVFQPDAPKPKAVSTVGHWLTHPYRITVEVRRPMPWNDDCLVQTDEGLVYNSYQHPDHAYIANPAPAKTAWFYEFMDYLIPDEVERTYFLNWLAQGVQDPMFRGALPLMVAKAQGTGRNSLAKIIQMIFGRANCQEISGEDMKEKFNEWLLKRFVFFPEILIEKKDQYSYYNRVKSECDPMVAWKEINPKYGRKFLSEVFTMAMMATNNADALGGMDNTDRRVYVITNAFSPATPAFFKKLHAHIAEPEEWLNELYSSLKNRDLSDWDGYAPAPETRGKTHMAELTEGPGDRIGRRVLDAWDCPIVPMNSLIELAQKLVPEVCSDEHDMNTWANISKHAGIYIRKNTYKVSDDVGNKQVRIGDERYRIAAKTPGWAESDAKELAQVEFPKLLKTQIHTDENGEKYALTWEDRLTDAVLEWESDE